MDIQSDFEQKISYLFKDFTYVDSENLILKGRMPDSLIQELNYFTECCNKIRSHDLYYLKNHLNVAENSFQTSVPVHVLEPSFIFAYVIHLTSFYLKQQQFPVKHERHVVMGRDPNHFDGYQFWLNYIAPGNYNNMHNHHALVSGIIYAENEMSLGTQFINGTKVSGEKGDIILFPSGLDHYVEENKSDKYRLTYAFNMNYIGTGNE